ncbi:hypothetical protein [Solimonas flava]|uniref:hypothetical protein n=1 Tax=Solimonas flava TaxID=415849 RepID=UPI0012B664E0|nr:hypothetical protein [Solimonas flava]
MIQPFSPEDIGSISKLAGILAVPFAAAAMFVDFGFWSVGQDKTVSALIASSVPAVALAAKIAAFLLGVVIVAFATEALRVLLAHSTPLYVFTGMALLAFGVLGLLKVGEHPFWHLSAFCFGLQVFHGESPNNSFKPTSTPPLRSGAAAA